jgi:thioredoxin reductase (NADPH)
LTGPAVAKSASWKEQRLPEVLETSLPGVFASGDCRSGTTKRVASAIGDGALAVTCVHHLLGIYATRQLDVLNKTSVDRSDAESH